MMWTASAFAANVPAVQHVASTLSNSATFGMSVTAGNLIVAKGVTTSGSGTFNCSDPTNGAWTSDLSVHDVPDGNTLGVAHFTNSAAGTLTVTCTPTAGATAIIELYEYPCSGTACVLDIATGQLSNGASPTSGNTSALSAPHEIVFGTIYDGNSNSITAGSGFTTLYSGGASASSASEDKDSGSGTAAVAATFSVNSASGNKLVGVVVFKVPASSTPTGGCIGCLLQ